MTLSTHAQNLEKLVPELRDRDYDEATAKFSYIGLTQEEKQEFDHALVKLLNLNEALREADKDPDKLQATLETGRRATILCFDKSPQRFDQFTQIQNAVSARLTELKEEQAKQERRAKKKEMARKVGTAGVEVARGLGPISLLLLQIVAGLSPFLVTGAGIYSIIRAHRPGVNYDGIALTAEECSKLASERTDRASFKSGNLESCDLSGMKLRSSDFSFAQASNISFADSNLRHSDFSYAALANTDMRGASVYSAEFIGADLSQANLTLVNAAQADFSETNLSGIIGSHGTFDHATLLNTQLQDAKLNNTTWNAAQLGRVDLSGADLTGAEFEGISPDKSVLDNVILEGTNLTGARFINAEISNVDFTSANLNGVYFDSTDFGDDVTFSCEQISQLKTDGWERLPKPEGCNSSPIKVSD